MSWNYKRTWVNSEEAEILWDQFTKPALSKAFTEILFMMENVCVCAILNLSPRNKGTFVEVNTHWRFNSNNASNPRLYISELPFNLQGGCGDAVVSWDLSTV